MSAEPGTDFHPEAGDPLYCSSDGHVMEPADLWRTHLPKRDRDRALHYAYRREGFFTFVDENGDEMVTSQLFRRPDGSGVMDAVDEHLRDLDHDGIWAEVLYPGLGMQIFMPDPHLALAHARVYNDFVAETYLPHERLLPVAAVPVRDVPAAVAEIERARHLGLAGILLPLLPPGKSYDAPEYEPVWAAAAANGLPISFHSFTGYRAEEDGSPDPAFHRLFSSRQRIDAMALAPTVRDAVRTVQQAIDFPQPIQVVIAQLVGSGLLERHPDLNVVAVENNAHWLASLMGGMDKAWTLGIGQPEVHLAGLFDDEQPSDRQPLMTNSFGPNTSWPYPLRPSDYVRRQVKVTFMDDPVALACRDLVGVETLMWGADYPHPEGTWPRSREAITQQFADIAHEDKLAICGGTMARFYGLDVPVAA